MIPNKTVKIILVSIAIILGIFILIYVLTWASVEKTVEHDPSIPHITTNGITFHSEAFGDPNNPVVIVVHGGPGNDYRSMLLLKELSDNYYVVFYDQRGTGLSPRVSKEELTFDQSIEDLNSIVDYYSDGKKVNLIAHSFGAILAVSYIGLYPEKVDKIVLSEPGFLTMQTAGMYMAYFQRKMQEKPPQSTFDKVIEWFELLHIRDYDGQEKADYLFMRNIMTDKPLQSEYYCNGELATTKNRLWRYSVLSSSSVQDVTSQTSEFVPMTEKGPIFSFAKYADKFTNKILFLASECNSVTGESTQKIHIELFPNAELKVIEDAGHDMHAGQPEAVQRAIREYFKEETPLS